MARVVSGKPRTTSDPRLAPGENLVEVFRNQVGRQGDKTALMSKVDGRWVGVSWRQFGENVLALAATFLSLGVRRGDRIAIFGYNSPAWAYADLASLTIGAVNVPIYFRSKAPQAEYILRDSEARGIVVGGKDQLETVLSIWDGLPALKWVIAREGGETAGRPGVISLEQALAGPNDPHAPQAPHGSAPESSELLAKAAGAAAEVGPDDLATIIYTSGTTGEPKGVMLTHRALLADAWAVAQLLPQISEKDVALSFMPTSHVLDRVCVHYLNLLGGGTVAYAQSLETVMQDLGEVRPTALVAVPRVFEKVYLAIHDKMAAAPPAQRRLFEWAMKVGGRVVAARQKRRAPGPWLGLQYGLAEALIYKRIRAVFGGRMHIFASGGAHLQEKIDVFFRVIGIPISHGFGLTEAACTVSTSTFEDFKPGALGHPVPGTEIKIAADGEILVRGDIVMAGYYKREAETAQALAGGWLHTGDLGYLDEDGYLVMTDRKKDILSTSGGKNISPQTIETLIKLDRTVEQAVVIAEGRPYVTALIVPNFAEVAAFLQREGLPPTGPGEAVRLEAVLALYQGVVDRVNAQLDGYEQIKRFALLPEEIAEESGGLTHTLKVKRRVVDEVYRGVIEGLYKPRGA